LTAIFVSDILSNKMADERQIRLLPSASTEPRRLLSKSTSLVLTAEALLLIGLLALSSPKNESSRSITSLAAAATPISLESPTTPLIPTPTLTPEPTRTLAPTLSPTPQIFRASSARFINDIEELQQTVSKQIGRVLFTSEDRAFISDLPNLDDENFTEFIRTSRDFGIDIARWRFRTGEESQNFVGIEYKYGGAGTIVSETKITVKPRINSIPGFEDIPELSAEEALFTYRRIPQERLPAFGYQVFQLPSEMRWNRVAEPIRFGESKHVFGVRGTYTTPQGRVYSAFVYDQGEAQYTITEPFHNPIFDRDRHFFFNPDRAVG
jgi:hypothetical protein